MTAESYNDIGQLLRRAREELRMPLEEVSRALHIRMRYLDALECGRLTELPGLSYAKGYLQAYAAYVGLDRDEILRRFEEVENLLGRRGFYFPQVFRKDKTPSRSIVWGGLAGAVLAYAFWLAVLQPPQMAISVVEPFSDKKAEAAAVSADVACLKPRPLYYPPCTMPWQPGFSLVSLQARMKLPWTKP